VDTVGCYSKLFLKLSIYLRLVSVKVDDMTLTLFSHLFHGS